MDDGQPGSSADSPNGKALGQFATEGLRVYRVVLPAFRYQGRFLIGLYLIARDCESDVLLSLQLRGFNRLRIEVKSGARFDMAKQSLNRFYVLAFVDEKVARLWRKLCNPNR